MKRLISLFLALLLALPLALPIFAVEAEGESETLVYPAISEADYNKLYVQGDLAMAADFFKMNEHWNLDGTVYKVPVGPSLNTAFQYDIDGDGTAESYDLTKAENRALKVTAEDDENKGKTLYEVARAEWRTAYVAFMNDTFLWTDPTGMRFSVYGNNNNNEAKEFAPIDAAKGFMQFRSDYHASGGIVFAGLSATTESTAQMVVSFGAEKASGTPLLFHNIRPYVNKTADEVYFFHSNGTSFNSTQFGGWYYTTKDTVRIAEYTSQTAARAAIKEAAEASAEALQAAEADGATYTAAPAKNANGSNNQNIYEVKKTVAGTATVVETYEVKSERHPEHTLLATPSFTISSKTPFTMTHSLMLREGDDDYMLRTEYGTVFSDTAQYGAEHNTNFDNGNHYIGYSSQSMGLQMYAYRHYYRVLTDLELKQNHFADLCKWFRLDVTPLYETVADELTLTASEAEINFLSAHLAGYTFNDEREVVATALAEAIAAWIFEGEGEAFDLFVSDIEAGRIDGAGVRALPESYHAEIYEAYKTFVDANANAEAKALQGAVDAAVAAILSKDYGDYYEKAPALTAEAFFGAEAELTDAAQHFSAIAKENNLDMTVLSGVDSAIRERIYETFADLRLGVYYHTAVLQARLADTTAELVEFYFGDGLVDDVLGFMGYQIRLYGELSFRAVFSIDKSVISLLEEHGYKVTVGVLQRDKSDDTMAVVKEEGAWIAATPANTNVAAANNRVIYETDKAYSSDCFEEDGTYRYAFELTPKSTLTDSFFRGYVTIEREGNEDTIFYCTTNTENFKKGVSIADIAKACKEKYGLISANIQALTPVRRVVQPVVFIGGENLSLFKVVTDEATKSVSDGFIAAFKAATGATLQTVAAADCEATDKGLIRFASGDGDSIALKEGNIAFTYTGDGSAALTALAAALAKPEAGYETFAYGEEEPWPVVLLATEHSLAAAE